MNPNVSRCRYDEAQGAQHKMMERKPWMGNTTMHIRRLGKSNPSILKGRDGSVMIYPKLIYLEV